MGAFKKAVKHDLKLRLAIAGPAGSGKTYTALRIAAALGGKIAYVDTEHGSASKYADLFDFDVMEMRPPFHPHRFVKGIQAAAAEHYPVVVIDSLSHAWNGTGGILELVDEAAARLRGNSYAAWKDVTPIQNDLIEAIVGANIHIIACMRSKMDYIQQKDDKGYTKIEKVGMAPVQREGFEYEFDVVMDMDINHRGVISKTRCPALSKRAFALPGEDVADILRVWMNSGNAAEDVVQAKAAEAPTPGLQEEVDFPNPHELKQRAAEAEAPAPDNPFEDAAPAAHELAITSQWQGPLDAQKWAVMVGACENEHHANQSWMASIKACKGYSEKKKQEVFLHFLRHQESKSQPN